MVMHSQVVSDEDAYGTEVADKDRLAHIVHVLSAFWSLMSNLLVSRPYLAYGVGAFAVGVVSRAMTDTGIVHSGALLVVTRYLQPAGVSFSTDMPFPNDANMVMHSQVVSDEDAYGTEVVDKDRLAHIVHVSSAFGSLMSDLLVSRSDLAYGVGAFAVGVVSHAMTDTGIVHSGALQVVSDEDAYGTEVADKDRLAHIVHVLSAFGSLMSDLLVSRPDLAYGVGAFAVGVVSRAMTGIGIVHSGALQIVDLATLTGACVVALGNDIAGLFTPNDDLAKELINACEKAGEKLWRMPMEEGYWEMMKSGVADMVNTGGRAGGSITAALFLKQFVDENVQWAHLDIAGPVWNEKKKGATGFAVGTLVEWVLSHSSSAP
ncbi:hypothetical protein L7F22_032466 [Adiantum nelumboides]|nr:hypothetical protein [Adiantum nelumboides]